jgi:hypothetical protein
MKKKKGLFSLWGSSSRRTRRRVRDPCWIHINCEAYPVPKFILDRQESEAKRADSVSHLDTFIPLLTFYPFIYLLGICVLLSISSLVTLNTSSSPSHSFLKMKSFRTHRSTSLPSNQPPKKSLFSKISRRLSLSSRRRTDSVRLYDESDDDDTIQVIPPEVNQILGPSSHNS